MGLKSKKITIIEGGKERKDSVFLALSKLKKNYKNHSKNFYRLSKNDKFVFGLEELVDKRAKDLRETQAQMALAQKNAKFGTFQYSFLNDSWNSSDEFDLILGVSKGIKKNLAGLQGLYEEIDEGYLQRIWSEMIENKQTNFSSDFKIKRVSDGQISSKNEFISLSGTS